MRSFAPGALLCAGLLAGGAAQAATTPPALPTENFNSVLGLLNFPDPNGYLLPSVPNLVIRTPQGVLTETSVGLRNIGGSFGGLQPGLSQVGGLFNNTAATVDAVNGLLGNLTLRSSWRSSTGETVVREHRVLPNLPFPVNVDRDVLPEYLVTVRSTGNAYSIKMDKALLAEQVIPLKLELIVPNPAGTGAGQLVSAGFDALSTQAPSSWNATLSLIDLADDVHLKLDSTARNPGLSYALVFNTYEQTPSGARIPQADGRLQYAIAPTQAGFEVQLTNQDQRVNLASDTRSPAQLEINRQADRADSSLYASFSQLPTASSLAINAPQGRFANLAYTGSHTMDILGVAYTDAPVDGDAIAANLTMAAVPTRFAADLRRDADGSTVLTYDTASRIENIGFTLDGYPLIKDIRHLFVQVDGLPSELSVELLENNANFARFVASNGEVDRLYVQALTDSGLFARPNVNAGFRSSPGGFTDNSNFDFTSDGITLREWSDTYLLMAQVRRLRTAAFGLTPRSVVGSVNATPVTGRDFGISLRQWHVSYAESQGYDYLTQYYDGWASNLPSAGFSFRVPDTTTHDLAANGTEATRRARRLELLSSGSGNILQFDLRSNFNNNLTYGRFSAYLVPEQANLCLGLGDGPSRDCLRSRPNGYESAATQPHDFTVNLDDFGSAARGFGTWGAGARFCFDQVEGPRCENGESQLSLALDNLNGIQNLQFNMQNQTCAGGGLLCGHFDVDTRGTQVVAGLAGSGVIGYRHTTAGLGERQTVDISLPNGFSASQRYTRWNAAVFTPGALDVSSARRGTVNCQGISVNADILGSTFGRNIAGDLLCR